MTYKLELDQPTLQRLIYILHYAGTKFANDTAYTDKARGQWAADCDAVTEELLQYYVDLWESEDNDKVLKVLMPGAVLNALGA